MPDDFLVVDIETDGELPWNNNLVALGMGDRVWRPDEGREEIRRLFSAPDCPIIVCHSNYDLRWLILDGAPFPDTLRFHDSKVMAFMLEAVQELGLDPLCQRYLGLPKLTKPIRSLKNVPMFDRSIWNEHVGNHELAAQLKKDKKYLVPMTEVPWEEMHDYNMEDLVHTKNLYITLREIMQQSGAWQLFLDEEAPFSRLLIEMEVVGMPMDYPALKKFYEERDIDRQILHDKLVDYTCVPTFNLKSGDQVAQFLYDEMPTFKVELEVPGLIDAHKKNKVEPGFMDEYLRAFVPKSVRIESIGNKYVRGVQTVGGLGLEPPKIRPKKGKTPARPPIDAERLTMLHGRHEWVKMYLRWKSINTLCTNYLEPWIELTHNGRLHGRFDQARAETGRVASRDPNLQAIPVAMEWNVRTLFAAPMVIGDYSGLDARVAAHFSEDPVMLDIFRTGKDLYGVLASNAWGGPADKTNENRSLMKILFLSAQYGSQAKSIGEKIAISGLGEDMAKQAPRLLKQLEETVPRLFEWRHEVEREARGLGYITTISGRRRFLPDLYHEEWWRMARAERQCVASKVQGSSADIVRKCMLRCREAYPQSVMTCILQVHDEVLWQRGPDWKDKYMPDIQNIMENGHEYELNLPMKFPMAMGDSWSEKDAQGARSYRVMGGIDGIGVAVA